jgi:putative ABC transport system ATP-binding protein
LTAEYSDRGEAIVAIRDLCKEFHRDEITIPVLMGINLDLQSGEYMALMGPSGSGKTTLLNIIAGLDRPTSGSVRVVGQDLGQASEGELARWRSQHIGFIFQLYNLIPVLTAYENVELPLTLTRLSKRERREHVEAALEVVGLSDRGDHYPRQLSGGQEQRVAIARAISTDPTLLVADEPTGDLDATSAGEILDLMQRLNEEFDKTIVMVTHDPNAAARAGRLLHLEKGVLVDGQPVSKRPFKEAAR